MAKHDRSSLISSRRLVTDRHLAMFYTKRRVARLATQIRNGVKEFLNVTGLFYGGYFVFLF